MAIATGTALAIGGLASAGAGIAGAKMQSSAAKKAAETQQRAADQAMAVQRDVYRDQMAMNQPYVQVGQQAIGTLGRLLGAPEGARFAAPALQPQPIAIPGSGARMSSPGSRLGAVMPQMGQGPAPMSGNPMPQGQNTAPQMSQQGPVFGGNGMIRLQAPDGSMGEVPAHLADQFIARGARRVQ